MNSSDRFYIALFVVNLALGAFCVVVNATALAPMFGFLAGYWLSFLRQRLQS